MLCLKQTFPRTVGALQVASRTLPAIQSAKFHVPTRKVNELNVYQSTERLIAKGNTPISQATSDLYTQFDPDGKKRALLDKKNPDCIKPGDVIRVTKADNTTFVGVLLGINRRHLASNILLRTKISNVAVEVRYHIFNPVVSSVEVLRIPRERWRRNKIYFIRGQPKFDVGDVDAEIRKAERKRQ